MPIANDMRFLALLLIALLITNPSTALAAAKKAAAKTEAVMNTEILSGGVVHNEGVFLPRGLILPIELKTPIDTRISKVGDQITAQITEDVMIGDYTVVPANSFVHGYISELIGPDKKFKAPKVSLEFDTLSLPSTNGARRYVPIKGSVQETQVISKSEEVTDERKSYKAKSKKAKALGALTGALFLHGVTRNIPQFTVIGITAISQYAYLGLGAIGGAALATSLITKDDIRVEPGAQLKIMLNEPTLETMGEKSLVSYNATRNVNAKLQSEGVLEQPLKDGGADIDSGKAYDQLTDMKSYMLQ